MAELLSYFPEVLSFILGTLGEILTMLVANPVLLTFVAIGLLGMLFAWARSFLHV